MAFPAIVAGLDLHVLAVAGRLHRGQDRRRRQPAARQRRLRQRRRGQQPAVRGGGGDRPGRRDARLPRRRTADRRPGEPVIAVPTGCAAAAPRDHGARAGGRLHAARAGRAELVQRRPRRSPGRRAGSPCTGGTSAAAQPRAPGTRCWSASRWRCWRRRSRWCSARWPALALRRTRFFGRNAVSLLIILPIALPGIVTGIALNNAFRTMLGLELGFLTIVVAHATFCIVTVFNNVQARLRRLGGNLEQASMDLGAGPFTTFRLVTFPMLRSALLAGGAAGVRAVLRRDRRDHVHRRRRRSRRCRSGSSRTCSGPTRRRSSTSSRRCWCCVSAVPIYLAQRLSGDTVSTGVATP